jgi:hypothetical protein
MNVIVKEWLALTMDERMICLEYKVWMQNKKAHDAPTSQAIGK